MPVGEDRGRVRRVMGGAVLCLWSCLAVPAGAQPGPPAGPLPQKKAVLEKWLSDAGLTGKLESLKLRKSEHPDPQSEGRPAYRWELRFRTGGDKAFQQFLEGWAKSRGRPFPEQSFYLLIHLLGVGREEASVHVFVVETEYAVYFDAARREVVMQPVTKRDLRVETPVRRTEADALTIRRTSVGQDLPKAIKGFLDSWFGAAAKGTADPPRLDWRPLQNDYLRVEVSGLKGQILRSHTYWEKLSLSLEVKPGENGWKLVGYFNGQYAAGLGANQPADEAYALMEKDYRGQLDTYANTVLSALQQHLER